MERKIEFREIRNFSQTIAVSSAFIRQNLSILVKSLFLLAVPITLFGLIGYSLCYFSAFGSIVKAGLDPGNIEGDTLENFQYMLYSYLFLPFIFAGYIVVSANIYEYMRLYVQSAQPWQMAPQVIIRQIVKKIGLYLGTFMLLYVVVLLAMVPAILFMALAVGISIAASPIFGVLAGLVMGMLLFYFMVSSALVIIIRVVEDLPFFVALRRSMYLIKNHWWQTFGLLVVSGMIIYSIMALPAILSTSILGLFAFFSVDQVTLIATILQTINGVIGIFAHSVILVVIAFQYFSLVEQKEAVGLRYRIGNIGQE